MKFLKKLACTAAAAMSFSAVQAAPVFNDWVFNPNGGGFDAGQRVNEYLDVNGNAFVQLKRLDETSFQFIENAVFNITQADSNGKLFPITYPGGNITVVLDAHGIGDYNGRFTFLGGEIGIFQNPTDGQYGGTDGIYGANLGKLIAEFYVLEGGGGLVDASGSPITNGQVSLMLQAGPLAPGYFFHGNGNDILFKEIMAFAFTNANTLGDPTKTLVDEVACQYAQFRGPGCDGTDYANAPGEYFFLANNGQFKLTDIGIPEPGSLALFGIALLGVGAVSHKRVRKD